MGGGVKGETDRPIGGPFSTSNLSVSMSRRHARRRRTAAIFFCFVFFLFVFFFYQSRRQRRNNKLAPKTTNPPTDVLHPLERRKTETKDERELATRRVAVAIDFPRDATCKKKHSIIPLCFQQKRTHCQEPANGNDTSSGANRATSATTLARNSGRSV